MKRMRNEEPSAESQKPDTCEDLPPAWRTKSPSKEASMKGLGASGEDTVAESSKMSKTSTLRGGAESVTSRGAATTREGNKAKPKRKAVQRRRDFMASLQELN